MSLTLNPRTVAEVVRALLRGEDHRGIVHELIDDMFLNDVLTFFGKVVEAKLTSQPISLAWYREHFLDPSLDKAEIAHNSGLGLKSIQNKRHSQRKTIVIEEAVAHHDSFVKLIDSLQDNDLNIDLALTLKGVTVNLDLNESLVVINAIAVRRAGLRGGGLEYSGQATGSPADGCSM